MGTPSSPQNAQDFLAPREHPLLYPGHRPDHSFVLADGMVWPMASHRAFQDFLGTKKVAPLEERYAVVGYGSNPGPGQLLSKFGADAIVPVVFGIMPNTKIIYNLISNHGYAFAEILFSEAYEECKVGVTFLDEKQLEVMIETEGNNYQLALSPYSVNLEFGESVPGGLQGTCYLFAGLKKIWVPQQYTQPVPLAEFSSKSAQNPPLNQEQTLALVLQEFELEARGIKTVQDLVHRLRSEAKWKDQAGKLKYDLQQAVDKAPNSHPPLADSLELLPGTELPQPASFKRMF